MKEVLITNHSFYDKVYEKTFVYGDKYKHFAVSDASSTLVPMYKELLKPVIGEKVKESFRDFVLSKVQTEQIQAIFEGKLEETLALRDLPEYPNKAIEYKGKTHELDITLTRPLDRRIDSYFLIITICQECLSENKPMYLSID